MNTRARRVARATLLVELTLLAIGCAAETRPPIADHEADEATSYDVQRIALDSLFNGRERAQRLVLWATDAGDGPTLDALGSAVRRPAVSRTIDVGQLAASLPARVVTESTVVDLFRRNADGWAAFFRNNSGTPGLIELSPVWLAPDGVRATTHIGRACGEHCRNAWWIAVRQANGRWRIQELRSVRVPGA